MSSSEWNIYFASGRVDTQSVKSDVGGSGSKGSEDGVIHVLLDAPEAKALEEQLGRIGAVTDREVPDGTNFTEDTAGPAGPTLGSFQLGGTRMHGLAPSELHIDPRAGAEDLLTPGIYAVSEWETEWKDSQKYEMTLDLGLVSETISTGFGTDFGRDFGE